MDYGILAGYIVVIGPIVAIVMALLTGWRARERECRDAQRAITRAQGDMIRERFGDHVQDGQRWDYAEEAWVPVEPAPLEPWTAAEREAFGVNDTDRLIARIDSELNPPLKAVEAPKTFMAGGKIIHVEEDAEVVEQFAWGQKKPVRTILSAPESFVRNRDGVWVQQ